VVVSQTRLTAKRKGRILLRNRKKEKTNWVFSVKKRNRGPREKGRNRAKKTGSMGSSSYWRKKEGNCPREENQPKEEGVKASNLIRVLSKWGRKRGL